MDYKRGSGAQTGINYKSLLYILQQGLPAHPADRDDDEDADDCGGGGGGGGDGGGGAGPGPGGPLHPDLPGPGLRLRRHRLHQRYQTIHRS